MDFVSRAQRFPITTHVRWRPKSRREHDEWLDGFSVNISRSGVLFCGDRFATAGTRIDLILALSADGYLVDCADIRCSGRIIRAERLLGRQSLASTIEGFSFLKSAGRDSFRKD